MYSVLIMKYGEDRPVRTIGPITTERRAHKVDDGININLNKEEYFTKIVFKGQLISSRRIF